MQQTSQNFSQSAEGLQKEVKNVRAETQAVFSEGIVKITYRSNEALTAIDCVEVIKKNILNLSTTFLDKNPLLNQEDLRTRVAYGEAVIADSVTVRQKTPTLLQFISMFDVATVLSFFGIAFFRRANGKKGMVQG